MAKAMCKSESTVPDVHARFHGPAPGYPIAA